MAGEPGNPTHDETHWILGKDQLRCLVSATRMDIVDHLAGRGALSIRELAEAIGKQPSALYHHLEKLLAVGLVEQAGRRVVNRKQEMLYATPARRMRLKRALAERSQPAIMADLVASLCRQSERDFARGQDRQTAKAEGEGRNLGFFRLVAKPSAKNLARINSLLDEIGELMWQAETGDEAVALTWVMAPLD